MEKINQQHLETLVTDLAERAKEIREVKGKDYSEDNDRLANFRRVADQLDVHPRLAWAFGFMKQVDAVLTWAKDGKVASEPIEGRFADIINYCYLGWAIEKACEGEERVGAETDSALTILCHDCKQRYKISGQDPFCPHEERPEERPEDCETTVR